METLGSVIAMMMFSLDEHNAVRIVSLAQGLVGFITLLFYLIFIIKDLEYYLHLRIGCIISLAMMLLFHLLSYSWPFLPNYVHSYGLNGIYFKIVNIKNMHIILVTENDLPVGCNADRFTWCKNLTAVNIYLFYISYVILIGLAFPLLTITLNTLFSNILGPRRQGTEQGWFQASSAGARMIGPLINTFLYTYDGPRAVWTLEIALLSFVIGSWGIFYNRMVDLKIPIPAQPEVFGYQNPQYVESDNDENEV